MIGLLSDRGAVAVADGSRVVDSERLELGALPELLAGHIRSDLLRHRLDRPFDGAVVGIAVDEAVDGVAHQDRRVGGVEDDDRASALGSTDGLQCRGGGSVNSSMLARVPGPADFDEIDETIST